MSNLLDVVIGVAFIFLSFSLLVSAVHEGGSRALGTRSKNLWKSLHDLLDSSALAEQISTRKRTLDAVKGLNGARDWRPRPLAEATELWTEKLYRHPLIRKLDDTKTLSKARLSHIEADDNRTQWVDSGEAHLTLGDVETSP